MKITFIGLGDIGSPMALRLNDVGHRVSGIDASSDAAQNYVAAGGTLVRDPQEIAASDIICLAVPDDQAVEHVLLTDGLLARMRPATAVLIHSTILPPTAVLLEEVASRRGIHVLDAPVSGGAARARSGDLSLMVGGRIPPFVQPVLDSLGRTTVAGPAGAGAALKLANQLAMFAAIQAVYEGGELASHYGVHLEVMLKTLSESTGDSWVVRNWGFMEQLARSYNASGTDVSFRPWSKDLWDVVAAARRAGVRVPLASLLSQIVADEIESRAHEEEGA